MSESEIAALEQRMVDAPPEVQVKFLLRVLEKTETELGIDLQSMEGQYHDACDERDRLQGELADIPEIVRDHFHALDPDAQSAEAQAEALLGRMRLTATKAHPFMPPASEWIDGINQFDLAPGLSTRFGFCRACGVVYPPDEAHECADDDVVEHEQYPTLRDMVENAEEVTVPAVILRELLAERDALASALERKSDEHEVTWRDWKRQRKRAQEAEASRDSWMRSHAQDSAANSYALQQIEAELERLRAVVGQAQKTWLAYTEHDDPETEAGADDAWMGAWDALRTYDVGGKATDA